MVTDEALVHLHPCVIPLLTFSLSLPRCEDGYNFATQWDSLSCQSDGTWSKHRVRCGPTPCRLPSNFSSPDLVITGKELTPVTGTITLSCPPGLHLHGSARAECQVRKMVVNYESKFLQSLYIVCGLLVESLSLYVHAHFKISLFFLR